MKPLICLIVFSLMAPINSLFAQTHKSNEQSTRIEQKHRVIILTDIGSDPDDMESMVRLLLYSNEIDIK